MVAKTVTSAWSNARFAEYLKELAEKIETGEVMPEALQVYRVEAYGKRSLLLTYKTPRRG